MVRDDHRPSCRTERVHASAQLAERRIRPEQVLRRDAADRQDQRRVDQLDLPVEVAAAEARLVLRRVAVARRATLEHVCNVNLSAREAQCAQHRIEQLPGAADERLALTIFLGAGRLTDDQPARAPVATREDGLRARAVQLAALARRDSRHQRVPVEAGFGAAGTRGRARRCGRIRREVENRLRRRVPLSGRRQNAPAHVDVDAEGLQVFAMARCATHRRRHGWE
jgi:hypothetical protein